MQANGGISETTNAGNVSGGNGNGPGNDNCLPDTMTAPSNNNNNNNNINPNPNVAQNATPAAASGNNNLIQQPQQNQQQQQQHLRSPTSSGQLQQLHLNQIHLPHHQQHQHLANHNHNNHNPNQSHHHMAPNVHHYVPQSAPGNYHQRQAQTYHNHQQQQMQHYHQHPSNKYNNQRVDSESNANHVLLITVINPHYTITCDLIHQICSPYGKVNRIVIFKKNGVQAMVEFDNVESAKRAKNTLYGCDIYSGCCTLRIEFAKPTRLNIHKNDNDSFDYTNPNLDGVAQDANSGVWTQNEQAQLATNSTGGLATVPVTGSGTHQQSPHQSHTNHPRGGLSGRNGGGRGGGVHHGGGGSHHFHPSHHPSSAPHHQVQPQVPLPPVTDPGQHGSPSYGLVTPIDQALETTDAFQQDASFNVSRDGGASGGQPQDYVGVDSYMPAHGHLPAHGGVHGNMYPRQDNHGHQQHHMRSNRVPNPNHGAAFSSANTSNALMGPPNMGQPQGTVMIIYGLQPERVNCDRLFNLFCLYGNVVRVKFLRTKEGCAMVQMGDVLAVDRCVSSLNKITLFDSEIQISYSKQPFLHDVIQPFILPDGSPSFKDFTANKNNRFKNPEVASKNRILPPSQVLHFFNAPLGITEDELVNLFKQNTGHEPVSIKIFTPKVDNFKSFSGLATFKDPAEATEALVICNHLTMPKPGAPHPYILRLCFSPPTYMRPPLPYPQPAIVNQ